GVRRLGEGAVVVVGVHGDRQADLLEVVPAGGPHGGLADLLDGRQEQADQDRDDGNDHQQLDQSHAATGGGRHNQLLTQVPSGGLLTGGRRATRRPANRSRR